MVTIKTILDDFNISDIDVAAISEFRGKARDGKSLSATRESVNKALDEKSVPLLFIVPEPPEGGSGGGGGGGDDGGGDDGGGDGGGPKGNGADPTSQGLLQFDDNADAERPDKPPPVRPLMRNIWAVEHVELSVGPRRLISLRSISSGLERYHEYGVQHQDVRDNIQDGQLVTVDPRGFIEFLSPETEEAARALYADRKTHTPNAWGR